MLVFWSMGELGTYFAFDIYWPSELNRKTKMTCVIEKPFANMHSEIKTHTHRMGKCKSWNWAFNCTLFWKSKISALKSVNFFLNWELTFYLIQITHSFSSCNSRLSNWNLTFSWKIGSIFHLNREISFRFDWFNL